TFFLLMNKTKALFKKAYFYNWDNGLAGLKKIVTSKDCDKATANMIFWHGQPSYFYNHEGIMQDYEQEQFGFLQELAEKLLTDSYPTIISYEVEEMFCPKELGSIPEVLAQAIVGT